MPVPLLITRHVHTEATVAVFEARDDDGCPMFIAVEPRYSVALIYELRQAGSVPVSVEPWQIMSDREARRYLPPTN